jgi:hypothetical protein
MFDLFSKYSLEFVFQQLEESRMLKFVCEGDFKELDIKGQKHARHFFLFSGLLLITKPARANRLQAKYAIPIENVLIWDLLDSDLGKFCECTQYLETIRLLTYSFAAPKGAQNGFQLVTYSGEKTKITFLCPSAGQKENWMNTINETVSSYGCK